MLHPLCDVLSQCFSVHAEKTSPDAQTSLKSVLQIKVRKLSFKSQQVSTTTLLEIHWLTGATHR